MNDAMIAVRAAASASATLMGSNALQLGWPDRHRVALSLASAMLDGLGPEQYGSDPAGWCIEKAAPAIERRLSGPEPDDLRAIGWPHVASAVSTVVGWLVEDGVLPTTAAVT